MKKRLFVFSGLVFAMLLAGCKIASLSTTDSDKMMAENGESGIYITLTEGSAARTALPTYEWGKFYYELYGSTDGGNSYIQLGTKVNGVITRKAFSWFYNETNPVILPVPAAKWVFQLRGFASEDMTGDTKPVIQGTTAQYDLTSGYQKVTFRMYPCAGKTGYAKVTVNFSSTVKTVKAAITDNPVATAEKLEGSDYYSLKTLTIVNGTSVVYATDAVNAAGEIVGLSSAEKHFARFFLYDSKGDLLCDFAESLVIIGGLSSESTITINDSDFHSYSTKLTLKKDDAVWSDCAYTVILKDTTTDKTYTMVSGGDGTFTGTLPEGTFSVIMEDSDGNQVDTGVTVNSNETDVEADYGTVTLPDAGSVTLTPADTTNVLKVDDNTYIIPASDSLDVKVDIKPGYSSSTGTVTLGSSVVAEGADTVVADGGTTSIAAGKTVNSDDITGAEIITYTISYDVTSWNDGYTAPASYTVENYASVILPTISNVPVTDSKVLDGWKNGDVIYTKITAGTTGNLNLTAIWKDSVSSEAPSAEEEAAGIKGTIYANGINLIIDWDDPDAHNYTYVYVDINNDGEFNESDGDYQVTGAANNDYSNYILNADSYNSDSPASDFTFTMKGGKIASLVGLGKDASNVSTVNISGYSVIGNGSTIGIDLPSLTNECVNITGAMSGDYSITLLSGNKYESGASYHKVAYINDSTFAQMGKFKCLYKDDKTEQTLGLMNVTENGTKKTIIYLANPDPIALPDPDAEGNTGIIWVTNADGTESDTQFTLGDSTNIQIPCSVFSIAVTDGTFTLKDGYRALRNYNEDGTYTEVTTKNLGQPDTTTYTEDLANLSSSLIYLHMMSENNEITAESATDFLKSITFTRSDTTKSIKIEINLETVPYSVIKAMSETKSFEYDEGNTKDYNGTFSYYNGSFYFGVKLYDSYDSSDDTITWLEAYKNAKDTIFNGLNGYLLTITSAVENNYIYSQMGMEKCWIGGSRMYPSDGKYDQDTYTIGTENYKYSGSNSRFIWQCGPEAGTWFQDGTVSSTSILSRTGYSKGDTNGYTNWESNEPNNSYSLSSNEMPETTVQFHSGGQWNDLKYNTPNTSYCPTGYIVEFRPYTNSWTTQKANYQSISCSMEYAKEKAE